MGVTCEFTVEVVEHPIDHIEVPDVILVAGEDGVWETEYWDDEIGQWMPCKWFYYFYQAKEVTVYYKDGRVETYTYSEAEEELGYILYSYADQSYENPWSEGTYTCTAELMAVTCEYNVHIVSDGNDEDLIITAQPENYIGKLNSYATFTVGVNKEDVSYQWYYSTDGVKWIKSTALLSISRNCIITVSESILGRFCHHSILGNRSLLNNLHTLLFEERRIITETGKNISQPQTCNHHSHCQQRKKPAQPSGKPLLCIGVLQFQFRKLGYFSKCLTEWDAYLGCSIYCPTIGIQQRSYVATS